MRNTGWRNATPLKKPAMSEGKITAKERYDARTAVYVSLKLNKGTDADILQAIDGKPKQTEIKRLIRQGMKNDPPKQ